jgi:hypothetical protein
MNKQYLSLLVVIIILWIICYRSNKLSFIPRSLTSLRKKVTGDDIDKLDDYWTNRKVNIVTSENPVADVLKSFGDINANDPYAATNTIDKSYLEYVSDTQVNNDTVRGHKRYLADTQGLTGTLGPTRIQTRDDDRSIVPWVGMPRSHWNRAPITSGARNTSSEPDEELIIMGQRQPYKI